MLDFLVSSKTRRRLLQLIWGAEETGSASYFAERAQVGFASAYRELRAMRSLALVVSERQGGAEVYRANASHPLADTLHKLVAAAPTPVVEQEGSRRLRRQLKALGAPLREDSEDPDVALEETVVRGVQLSRHDPDVARTLPVCLYRQRDALRAEVLRHYAVQFGEKRTLGFFLDLTARLSGEARFAAWAKSLRDRRCTAPLDFFHGASRSRPERQRADEKTPSVARRWELRMNMAEDTFRSTFEKFVHGA
jgi:hypothetical protein